MHLHEIKPVRKELYKKLITLLYEKQFYHIGSCLSVLDILIYIWLHKKRHIDKVILSKGHAAPALYVIMNYLGIIPDEEMQSFHTDGTKLANHPPEHYKRDIPFPSGSLGHGLSLATGIAHGYLLKKDGRKTLPHTYCVMSDGECNEGQVWEAAQYASAQKLHNLTVFVDKNGIQASGFIHEVLGDPTTKQRWESFGFAAEECDGHSLESIHEAVKKVHTQKERPSVVICNTVKGKGVSFMEHTIEWHYNIMEDDHFKQAIAEIEQNL